jgi:hypothetical protein
VVEYLYAELSVVVLLKEGLHSCFEISVE